MTDVRIVRAEEDHAALVCSLLEQVGPDFPIPLATKTHIPTYARKLIRLGLVLMALDCKGSPVAVVGGYANDERSRVAEMTVVAAVRNVRGTGVADALIQAFEREARAAHMRILAAEVHRHNTAAIGLYARHGMVEHGSARHDCDIRMRSVIAGLCEARPNLLITSVGRRSYLVDWFKRAMPHGGEVHVTNSSSLTPAFAVAHKATVCPQIYDKDYLPFLLSYCEQNAVGAVVSLFDVDIPVLAAHADEFYCRGCVLVVASKPIADICSDKYQTARWLSSMGIRTPVAFCTLGDAVQALGDGTMNFPVVIKPRWGMGSIGVEVAHDMEELVALHKVVRRKIQESYLRFESSVDPECSVLVQELLDGQEYGMDIINNLDGELRSVVLRKKVAMRSGETDIAEVVPVQEDFERIARVISVASRHPGNMDVDLFETDHAIYVLELNARFGGGYPFGHVAGIDLPHALVQWLRDEEATASALEVTEYGTYCKDITIRRM